MKCPNCGREREVTTRDFIFALMVDLGGARTNMDFTRCSCPKDIKPPTYWKANNLTEEEVREMGELEYKIWKIHHSPKMRDCVILDYAYHITNNGRVICDAQGDLVDITEDIIEL